MEPLKEMFNLAYFEHLSIELSKSSSDFDTSLFLKEVTRDLASQSLNQRMRHASLTLNKFLPKDFKKAVGILKSTIQHTKRGYTNLLFPDYVGLYGLEHFELSMEALKYFTCFGSSEFAIREFLKRDFKKTIKVMTIWAEDTNEHVRRLASEGSRPRLPWSFKIDEVIKDPKLTQVILFKLKEDKSAYVKKSVANHLNDVSKDHPNQMLAFVKTWNKSNPDSAWIIKHASRTLIKKGHSGSLAVFDFEKHPKIEISQFKIHPTKIHLGEVISFSFSLKSLKSKTQKLVIDYKMHYCKKSGASSVKVFKLKEVQLQANQVLCILKKQEIKDFSTRTHYPGKHKIEIQINGKILAVSGFQLIS